MKKPLHSNNEFYDGDHEHDPVEYNSFVSKLSYGFLIALIILAVAAIIVAVTSPGAKAQVIEHPKDSVSMMYISTEQAVGYVAHEMRISQREYKQAWMCNLSGSVLMITGFVMNENFSDNDPHTATANPFKPICIGIGGALNVIGLILHIDSRSHLTKAGRIYLTPQGSLLLKIGK